jgi:hypothetical protein
MSRRPFDRPRVVRPEVDDLIMSCLEVDRADRPQTIEAVMRRFADAIPNGQALLQFFAPRFVDRAPASANLAAADVIDLAAYRRSDR